MNYLSTLFFKKLGENYNSRNVRRTFAVVKKELIKQLIFFPSISEELFMEIKDLHDVSKEFICSDSKPKTNHSFLNETQDTF